MKDICRICARELCGNQRRWIFHTASKLNLQVLLSHVLEKEVLRDGRAEFACSKCTFMLDRIYRFDTVIARVEALSVERLQKLVSEKDRLKLCVANLYRKNNADMCTESKAGDSTVDVSSQPEARYAALLQDDFAYSGFESWTEHDDSLPEHSNCHFTDATGNRSKRCHCCAVLRVPDADYEAICKVPRKLGRSFSTVPFTRCSASIFNEEVAEPILAEVQLDKGITERESMEKVSSESSESLHRTTEDSSLLHEEEQRIEGTNEDPKWDFCVHNNTMQSYSLQIGKLNAALSLLKAFDYKPVQSPKGSRIPVKSSPPVSRSTTLPTDGSSLPHLLIADLGFMDINTQPVHGIAHDFIPELVCLQELWDDVYEDYIPLRIENLFEKQYHDLNLSDVPPEQRDSESQTEELLIQTLQDRLQQLEAKNKEHIHLLQYQANSEKEPRIHDFMLEKLQERIRDRDKALEQAIDEKYRALEEREHMLRQLQLAIREKEHDLERLSSVLSCSEETINSLDCMLKSKEIEIGHTSTMYKNLQWLVRETEEKYKNAIKERESFIQQLQASLHDRHKELEAIIVGCPEKFSVVKNELFEQLQLYLQNKEKMLQDILRDKNQEMAEHEKEIIKLLETVSTRDQLKEEIFERGSDHRKRMVIVKNDRTNTEINKDFQNILEKELANANEEFQIVFHKEKETRAELCSLQTLFAKQNENLHVQAADVESLTRNIQIKEELIKDLQVQLVNPEEVPVIESLTHEVLKLREKVAVMELHDQEGFGNRSQELVLLLERLVTERARLNNALLSEREMYSNLLNLHSQPKSCEESKTLQLELEAVRMLRGRLEEAWGQSLQQLSNLEAEKRAAIEFGGGDRASFRAPPKHAF